MNPSMIKRRSLWSGILGVVLVLCCGSASSSFAQKRTNDVSAARNRTATGIVYISSNNPGANENSVIAYTRRVDGSLRRLGSFPTGGSGIFDVVGITGQPTEGIPFNSGDFMLGIDIGPYDSDTAVIINDAGTLLFAVNSGSDTIAVFNIERDGTLSAVRGSPFPSGGNTPVSLALANNDTTLIVVNKDDDTGTGCTERTNNRNAPCGQRANVTTFEVRRDGRLRSNGGSTIRLPVTDGAGVFPVGHSSSPAQVLVSPDGKIAFVVDFLGGFLRPFIIRKNGRLDEQTPHDLRSIDLGAPGPPFPLGAYAHPTLPILYVGFVLQNRLGVYSYNSRGELTFLRSVPNSGVATCWLYMTRDGSRLYTANQLDNTVSVYNTTNATRPREIQKVTLAGSCGEPSHIELDPTEQFLHVITTRVTNRCAPRDPDSNLLHTLRVLPNRDGDVPRGGLIEFAPTRVRTGDRTTRIQGIATL